MCPQSPSRQAVVLGRLSLNVCLRQRQRQWFPNFLLSQSCFLYSGYVALLYSPVRVGGAGVEPNQTIPSSFHVSSLLAQLYFPHKLEWESIDMIHRKRKEYKRAVSYVYIYGTAR